MVKSIMTREETAKIVRVLSIAFNSFLRDKSQSEIGEVIDLWCLMFNEYEYAEVNAALKTFIATSKYPPTIAEVLNKLNLLRTAATNELNEMTAWEIVYKGICDSNYHAQEHYDNFPESIKNCIRTPATLKEWAKLGIEEVNTVIHSNFMRTFRGEQARAKEISKIPKDVMQMIENKKNEQTPRIEKPKYDIKKITDEALRR